MTLKIITHPIDARGPTYIGSKLVYPGESVTADVPDADETTTTNDGTAPTLADLQKSSIEAIKKALPALTGGDLDALLKLEQDAAKPRTTLISEIEAEKLKRAAGGA